MDREDTRTRSSKLIVKEGGLPNEEQDTITGGLDNIVESLRRLCEPSVDPHDQRGTTDFIREKWSQIAKKLVAAFLVELWTLDEKRNKPVEPIYRRITDTTNPVGAEFLSQNIRTAIKLSVPKAQDRDLFLCRLATIVTSLSDSLSHQVQERATEQLILAGSPYQNPLSPYLTNSAPHLKKILSDVLGFLNARIDNPAGDKTLRISRTDLKKSRSELVRLMKCWDDDLGKIAEELAKEVLGEKFDGAVKDNGSSKSYQSRDSEDPTELFSREKEPLSLAKKLMIALLDTLNQYVEPEIKVTGKGDGGELRVVDDVLGIRVVSNNAEALFNDHLKQQEFIKTAIARVLGMKVNNVRSDLIKIINHEDKTTETGFSNRRIHLVVLSPHGIKQLVDAEVRQLSGKNREQQALKKILQQLPFGSTESEKSSLLLSPPFTLIEIQYLTPDQYENSLQGDLAHSTYKKKIFESLELRGRQYPAIGFLTKVMEWFCVGGEEQLPQFAGFSVKITD